MGFNNNLKYVIVSKLFFHLFQSIYFERTTELPNRSIKIGTRGSPLALKQAYETRDQLIKAHGLSESEFEIVSIKTSGDKLVDKPLSEFGGKGLFTKEIEHALLSETIDLAVHSTKDMATEIPAGLEISCYLKREDVRDAFISHKSFTLMDLPDGSVIGTSSLRRQAFVLNLRPDLKVVPFRGNIETRLQKLKNNEVDATLLAFAGLMRLGMETVATSIFEADSLLPAIGQGAICIEIKQGIEQIQELLAPINHQQTATCLLTEREFLKELEGSCRTPIAGLARIAGQTIIMRGAVLSEDGQQKFEITKEGSVDKPIELGREVANELRSLAGNKFFENW